jgi:hypothetical protein
VRFGEQFPDLGGTLAEYGPGGGGVLVQAGLVLLAPAGRGGGLVGVAGGFDLAVLFLPAGGTEFLGNVLGGPGGLGLIRPPAGEQLPIGEVADVDTLDTGHDSERGVPFRPCFRESGGWFGADGLAGVVPAVARCSGCRVQRGA